MFILSTAFCSALLFDEFYEDKANVITTKSSHCKFIESAGNFSLPKNFKIIADRNAEINFKGLLVHNRMKVSRNLGRLCVYK